MSILRELCELRERKRFFSQRSQSAQRKSKENISLWITSGLDGLLRIPMKKIF